MGNGYFGDGYEDVQQFEMRIPYLKSAKRVADRWGGSSNLAKFAENLGPWLILKHITEYGNVVRATFLSSPDDMTVAGDIRAAAKECRARDIQISDPDVSDNVRIDVTFWKNKENQKSNKTKETKKMNADNEFYYALLQSSGVKMVKTTGIFGASSEDKSFTYLCAVSVTVGDSVVVQMRDGMGVATVTEVLDDWDMEVFETHSELKWVVNVVDVSNAEVYEKQRKAVMEQLRQSRLVEKARTFAQSANLDFNSLVQNTRNNLAIEKTDSGSE